MIKSKLVLYLSRLSKSDLRLFRDFVHSPFFNKHQKTTELLDYILQSPAWDDGHLQKERAFQHLFPTQTYEDQLLRTLISYLLQLFYRFYAQQQRDATPEDSEIQLLEMALQSGQKQLFEQTARRLGKALPTQQLRDSHYYRHASRYQRLLDTYDLKYGKRVSGGFLEQAITHFDTHYLSERLRMACEMLARKQVMGQQYSSTFIDILIRFLEDEQTYFKTLTGVWIYYLIYKMMTEGEEEYFFQLKSRLKKDIALFSHQEGRDLYTHALNYCIGRINFGASTFKEETFELYQQMLTSGLLYVDQLLPQWDYTNIVALGCELQKKEWTESFINEQKRYLPKAERENTHTYNLAAYHHAQHNYSEAIRLLQKVVFTEVYYNMLTRILMLKIYFETRDATALEYFLETFRIYVLRNKQLGSQRRKSALDLIKYTRSLFRLLQRQSFLSREEFQRKMGALQGRMENNQRVLSKSWLLLQIKANAPT